MVAQIDSNYRAYGYTKTLRRLSSYGLFEGRPATTKGQWMNPLVFSWLKTLAAVPGEPKVDRPLFITGLGRSGTTILGVLMSLHRDVGFLNEPKAMWHVIDERQDVNGNYGGQSVRYRLTPEDVTDDIVQRAHRVFGRYLSVVGAARVVDKYPELIFRVDYVRRIFPDARFIFIYRNGVDACQSIVKWSERLGVKKGEDLEDWWGRNDSKWLNMWRELIEPDPDYAEVRALRASAIDHANRAALEWVITMREGWRQAASNPDRVVKIRYEDLLSDSKTELERLLSVCELGVDPMVIEYARKSLYDNPAKPLPALLPPVQKLFDETMSMLGYQA